MQELDGRVAFVTGAGSRTGLGRSICHTLARAGASLVVGELRCEQDGAGWHGAASVVEEIRDAGGVAIDVYGDVSDPSQVDAMFHEIDANLGRLDIFVANAACPPVGDRVPVVDMPLEAFDAVHKVNVRGTFLTCQRAARRLMAQEQGGRIIIMSSSMGKRGLPKNGAYSSSKFAVNGLMQCLAHELGSYGITVNAVCPGAIHTDRLLQLAEANRRNGEPLEDSLRALIDISNSRIPLGHMGTPEDVAEMVYFLCSPRGKFLTGLSISVAGGAVMH